MTIASRSTLVLVTCGLLLLTFAPAQYFGRQQDDVLYFVGANALARGQYCLLTTPGCPALTVINPGWPLLLAPIAFFTERPGAYQIFSALLLALSPFVLWLWLKRRTDETSALLIIALFASNPLVFSQSGVVMSEIPFLLVQYLLLVAAENRAAWGVGLLSFALLSMRTAGLAVLPAVAWPFISRKKWRDASRALVLPFVFFVVWLAWCYRATGSVAKFDLLPGTYAQHFATKLLEIAVINLRWYTTTWGGCFLPPAWAGSMWAFLLGIGMAAFSIRGLFLVLRRRPEDPAALSLLGTGLLLTAWGWQYERYLLPLLPLLFWSVAQGLGQWKKPALVALLLLQIACQMAPRLGRPGPWDKPELSATYAWLSARPRPALLTSVEYVRDGYLSGLPSVPFPDFESPAQMAGALKSRGVRYVLSVQSLDYGLEADPTSLIRRSVDRAQRHLLDARFFRPIHSEPTEKSVIYEPL